MAVKSDALVALFVGSHFCGWGFPNIVKKGGVGEFAGGKGGGF